MIGVVSGVVSAATFDVLLAAASAGFVLTAWIFPGDEPSVVTDGGEELFDDDGADDLDLDGDGLDGLDLGDGDDLDGDLGDEGFDGDDLDGGGAAGPDLEPRVDELEAQIENVAGQVSSAQHESEELREATERIEDNVRQLLDIYALVTKGANPFADDSDGPMDLEIGETLDIFGADDEDDGDDETDDTGGGMADTDEMLDDIDEMASEAREQLEEEAAEDEEDGKDEEDEDEGEATTFDDLKSEYESDESLEELAGDADDDESGDDGPDAEEATGDARPEDGFEFGNEPEPDGTDGAKPYLATLPDGYGTDVLVMEWLGYLVARSDPRSAARAIERYESLGWLGAPVAEELRAILAGARFDGAGSGGSLSADHHRRSLEYVARLSDGTFGDPASMLALNGATSSLESNGGDR